MLSHIAVKSETKVVVLLETGGAPHSEMSPTFQIETAPISSFGLERVDENLEACY